jgi:hypothetical protein
LYALGEIVLVVIGILIAISINNWNEKRKNDSISQHYLNLLREEFEFNKQNLQNVVGQNDTNAHNGLQVLKYTGPSKPEISEKSFDSLMIMIIGNEVEFEPRNEIVNELISTGKLSLFNNADIRTSLSSWSGAIQRVKFQEAKLSKYRFQLLDLTMKHINLRDAIVNSRGEIFGITASKFNKKNTQILQLQEFESLMTSFIGASKFADRRFEALARKIDEILYLINQEMTN